ncbi:MAG: acyl-CoA dehydrogenase family protein [Pseudomonadales bacterium]|nr:acyl-CoA dehydrogenase family protein [Pseudomonadales bacterium]
MSIFQQQVEGLQFQLRVIAHFNQVSSTPAFSHLDPDLVDMMLSQAARFSREALSPLAQRGDSDACRLQDGKVSLPPGTAETYRQWCELGFPGLSLPMSVDGLAFPRIIQSAIQELSDAANLAFGMLAINLRCAALTLLRHASEELCQRWVPGLVSGELASTIVISEPQAGSDVGRIRTAATPTTDGRWLVSGSKIWISYGDHDATEQILHLVLARMPGGETGTRGLGLFAVPKFTQEHAGNGVKVLRLEHKLGLHASPTCVMEFDAAQGWLVGEPGQGIQALFVMMNAMRLAVSVQGSAVANTATLQAIAYANERPQGGRPDQKAPMISAHADVRRMLLDMTAQSELLRALSLRTAFYLDMGEADEDPARAQRQQKIGELLLPVAKTLSAELAFQVASQGIQVLGGYGYTRDYPMERLLRDIRVASIYEGTSGIQALDFSKRKLLGDDTASLRELLADIRSSLASAGPDNPLSSPLSNSLVLFEETVALVLSAAREDKSSLDARAYNLLRCCGLLLMGWCGLDLYAACTENSPYQNRLKDALALFAWSLEAETGLWARKCLQPQ